MKNHFLKSVFHEFVRVAVSNKSIITVVGNFFFFSWGKQYNYFYDRLGSCIKVKFDPSSWRNWNRITGSTLFFHFIVRCFSSKTDNDYKFLIKLYIFATIFFPDISIKSNNFEKKNIVGRVRFQSNSHVRLKFMKNKIKKLFLFIQYFPPISAGSF